MGLIMLQTIIISVKESFRNMKVIITGICAVLFIFFFEVYDIQTGIWGTFFISHILLMIFYLSAHQKRICKESDPLLIVREYAEVPNYFYVLPTGILLVSLAIVGRNSEGFIPIIVLLTITIFCLIYNCSEQNVLRNINLEDNQIGRLLDRKDALLQIFLIMQSISLGIFYFSTLVELKDEMVAGLFVVELVIHLLIYAQNYSVGQKIRDNIIGEIPEVYPKWQLFVPKKVGIGFTLNFKCPLTYVLILVAAIFTILLLVES
jgi:hypothetical protein